PGTTEESIHDIKSFLDDLPPTQNETLASLVTHVFDPPVSFADLLAEEDVCPLLVASYVIQETESIEKEGQMTTWHNFDFNGMKIVIREEPAGLNGNQKPEFNYHEIMVESPLIRLQGGLTVDLTTIEVGTLLGKPTNADFID